MPKTTFHSLRGEIDALIAGSGRKTATLLQLLKETGIRLGEAWRLKWTDLDLVNKTVLVNEPEKNSRPRILRISPTLAEMMNNLKHDCERIFSGAGLHSMKVTFATQRKRIALKLKNPRLRRITFHTLRHWKATTLYHETKDVLYVMKTLGYRDVRNTLLYIDLEAATYPNAKDEYIAKVAETEKEICSLVEAGFEYVCECEHGKIFKKRK